MRVTIIRRLSDIVKEQDIGVHTLSSFPEMNSRYSSPEFFCLICSIKMEVGIEDCLHIEFEYNKSKYEPSILLFAHVVDISQVQISLEGCDRGENLLPSCPHQDQAHGARHLEARVDGIRFHHAACACSWLLLIPMPQPTAFFAVSIVSTPFSFFL